MEHGSAPTCGPSWSFSSSSRRWEHSTLASSISKPTCMALSGLAFSLSLNSLKYTKRQYGNRIKCNENSRPIVPEGVFVLHVCAFCTFSIAVFEFFLVILLFLFLFFLDLESSFHKAKLFPFGIDKAVWMLNNIQFTFCLYPLPWMVIVGLVANRSQNGPNGRTAENWQKTVNKWTCESLEETQKKKNTSHVNK